jgi:mono/diheme cytochrome c family protein
VVIDAMDVSRARRRALLRSAVRFLAPMVAMPLLAGWYLWTMPPDSRSWVLGGSPAMNLFFVASVAASLLIALYAIGALLYKQLYMNGATALLLLALAFGATAGGEFVREGARKPFAIRQVLYSNAIAPATVARLRREGSVTRDPYPLRDGIAYPNRQLSLGARVYRAQCSVCHTLGGVNDLVELVANWGIDQQRLNIAKLQHTKGFMPPFAGPPRELEALVQMLRWRAADMPGRWPVSNEPAITAQLQRFLDEAGTRAGSFGAPAGDKRHAPRGGGK